jgi:plastocyanin
MHRVLALGALMAAMSALALLPVSRSDAATRNVNVGQKYDGSGAFLFNPSIQSAIVGDTVHFAWFSGIHFIKSYDESPPGTPVWQGGFGMAGDSLDHAFPISGSYTYYCSLHAPRDAAAPANIDASIADGQMVGKIIVSSTVGGVSEQVDGSTLAVADGDSSEPQWMYYVSGAAIVVMLSSASLVLHLRRRRYQE